jgi:phenylacetic acid degradation operon negative regulatory protein
MKAKTELLLYQLLWLGDQLTRPTFRNLSASFETWAYSNRLQQTIRQLESKQLLETQGKSLDRVIRLTEKGRQLLSGARNPEAEWAKEWDGAWRMVIFDIPESHRRLRRKLRDILRANHFGWLQQSVWLSPHSMDSINKLIRKATPGLASLSLMDCHPLPGNSNSDLVKGAWDFSKINAGYESYIQHIKQFRANQITTNANRFFAEEKLLWDTALKHDPLLPKQLIPNGYLGEKAWCLRKKKLPRIVSALLKQQARVTS